MSESLFDIFGDRLTKASTRTLPRQPLSNNENFGKVGLTDLKPNEPLKKAGETKKSFLANAGKALRDIMTPAKTVYSPRCRNVDTSAQKVLKSQLIYSDELDEDAKRVYEEIEFTYKHDNFHTDLEDYLFGPEFQVPSSLSPPNTPPTTNINSSMEFDCSYEDEFFTDSFADSNLNRFPEDDFPDLFID